jgi:hypothetical protein
MSPVGPGLIIPMESIVNTTPVKKEDVASMSELEKKLIKHVDERFKDIENRVKTIKPASPTVDYTELEGRIKTSIKSEIKDYLCSDCVKQGSYDADKKAINALINARFTELSEPLRISIDNLNTELQRINAENATIKADNSAIKADNSALRREQAALQTSQTTLQRENQQFDSRIKAIETAIFTINDTIKQKITDETKALKQTLAAQQLKATEIDDNTKRLQAELNTLLSKESNDELKRTLTAQIDELNRRHTADIVAVKQETINLLTTQKTELLADFERFTKQKLAELEAKVNTINGTQSKPFEEEITKLRTSVEAQIASLTKKYDENIDKINESNQAQIAINVSFNNYFRDLRQKLSEIETKMNTRFDEIKKIAQEKIAEQRASQIEKEKAIAAKARERQARLGERQARLGERQDTLAEATNDELRTSLAQLEQKYDTELARIRAETAELLTKQRDGIIANLNSNADNKIAKLEKKITDINIPVDNSQQLQDQIAQIKTTHDTQMTELKGIYDKQIDEIKASYQGYIDRINSTLQSLNDKMAALERQMTTQLSLDDISNIKRNLTELSTELAEVKSNMPRVSKENLTDLFKRVATLDKLIPQVESVIPQVKDLNKLADTIQDKEIEENASILEEIESKLADIKILKAEFEDLDVYTSTEVIDEAIDKINTRLISLKKQGAFGVTAFAQAILELKKQVLKIHKQYSREVSELRAKLLQEVNRRLDNINTPEMIALSNSLKGVDVVSFKKLKELLEKTDLAQISAPAPAPTPAPTPAPAPASTQVSTVSPVLATPTLSPLVSDKARKLAELEQIKASDKEKLDAIDAVIKSMKAKHQVLSTTNLDYLIEAARRKLYLKESNIDRNKAIIDFERIESGTRSSIEAKIKEAPYFIDEATRKAKEGREQVDRINNQAERDIDRTDLETIRNKKILRVLEENVKINNSLLDGIINNQMKNLLDKRILMLENFMRDIDKLKNKYMIGGNNEYTLSATSEFNNYNNYLSETSED